MKTIFTVLASTALLYFIFLGMVALLKNFLIFPAPKAGKEKAQLLLPLANGEKISARWIPSNKTPIVILYSHGNGEDLPQIAERLQIFRSMGFSVFAYDYIGYGQSKGRPSEEKIYLAADAAWKFLTQEKNIEPKNIAIVGYSLGSAAASYLAQKHPEARCLQIAGGFSDGVNTICPFKIYPFPILDNASKLAECKLPTLLVHGKKDRIVPPRNARKNFAILKCHKRLLWLEDIGHYMNNSEIYFDALESFINNPTK